MSLYLIPSLLKNIPMEQLEILQAQARDLSRKIYFLKDIVSEKNMKYLKLHR